MSICCIDTTNRTIISYQCNFPKFSFVFFWPILLENIHGYFCGMFSRQKVSMDIFLVLVSYDSFFFRCSECWNRPDSEHITGRPLGVPIHLVYW